MTFRSFIFFCLLSSSLLGEIFGNIGVELPHLGVTFLDRSFITHRKPWGIKNQWFIGTSLASAISYRYWWVAETSIGLGKLEQKSSPYVSSLEAGGGLRYFFSEGDLRPYAQIGINYLHFLGEGGQKLPLDTSWPIWVGLKPAAGFLWSFYSEMAFAVEASYAFLLNINEPFRHALATKISYSLYF